MARPNLVWFLTDDQDQLLGGSFPTVGEATPMPKTRELMQAGGAHATRWYIHTPICSPSRSELLTGRYFHNIKESGPSYMHVNYTLVNQNTFAGLLQTEGGYTTGLFGKYLNVMPSEPPPGFDAWLANDGGSYIAPSFQTRGIDGLPDGEVQFSNAAANYSTAVIGNASVAWIRKVAARGRPFMAYIAPKAAHEPFNPAPWYRDHWDPSWPLHEPRPGNWNCSARDRAAHHGNVGTEPMITGSASRVITGVFRNRWRTLMSVDDLIADVFQTVADLGLADSTYFLFSSDHGFQLGQFNIPMDKRHVYEWDTRIHLLARGPGIAPGTAVGVPGTQVDIAPTLLGLAGVAAPESMDGRSIVPFLVDPSAASPSLPESTQLHLEGLGDLGAYRARWREEVFLEYYFVDPNPKCMEGCEAGGRGGGYPHGDAMCVDLAAGTGCWCGRGPNSSDCYATEDRANNFIALRSFAAGADELYAEFQRGDLAEGPVDFDAVDFTEYYDLAADPWQMRNLASDPSSLARREALRGRLRRWLACSGKSCP